MSADPNVSGKSSRGSLHGVPSESRSTGDACAFVQDLMSQLEAYADVERASLIKDEPSSQLMPPCTPKVLERISEECGIKLPTKETAKSLTSDAEKLHAEKLATRKKELVGKTVTGRLKPSHMGRRKGFFIKWNEHDNDTVFITKDRVEQALGPNPKLGLMVSCTIVDLGPSWAPVDRQHPYSQAVVPVDTRWMNRQPSRQPSSSSITPDTVPSDEISNLSLDVTPPSTTTTPSPRTTVQENWQKIQAACKDLLAKKQLAANSWDLVKTAIPAMLEDKTEMPRNRRSSAFACRQHRRSDMGNASRSWRRGGASTTTTSHSSRGVRRPTRRPMLPPRSQSSRGVRPSRADLTELRRENTTGNMK